MAGGRQRNGPTRCFVSLVPHAEDLEALAALQGRALAACEGEGLRPVPRRALHVTLAFLGDRDAEQVRRVAAIVRMFGAVTAPIAAHTGALLALPEPQHARVIATGLDSGGRIEALAAELREDLLEAGVAGFDGRAFLPHLTLARARASVRLGAPPAGVDLRLTQIGLHASHRTASGAYYEALCLAPLAGPEPG